MTHKCVQTAYHTNHCIRYGTLHSTSTEIPVLNFERLRLHWQRRSRRKDKWSTPNTRSNAYYINKREYRTTETKT